MILFADFDLGDLMKIVMPLVFFGIWIANAVFGNREKNTTTQWPRPVRSPFGTPPPQRRPAEHGDIAEVDDVLEEVAPGGPFPPLTGSPVVLVPVERTPSGRSFPPPLGRPAAGPPAPPRTPLVQRPASRSPGRKPARAGNRQTGRGLAAQPQAPPRRVAPAETPADRGAASAAPPPSPSTRAPAVSVAQIAAMLHSPENLRRAFVLSEILGRPRSQRR